MVLYAEGSATVCSELGKQPIVRSFDKGFDSIFISVSLGIIFRQSWKTSALFVNCALKSFTVNF